MSELPSGWAVQPLGEAVDVLDSRRIPVNGDERAKRHGPIPYFGATGQVGWIDDFLFDEELVLLGEDGAPFFDITRPKAYVVRGKSWVNNHAHVLRGRSLLNSFLVHQLNQLDYHGAVSGTTRLKLPQAQMRALCLRVAPLNEQARIVEEVEKQLTRLDAGVEALKRVQAQLKKYRASVLKAACEGRLVPTEAELARREKRDYEPAAQLLERILKERRSRWEEDQLAKFKAAGKPPKDDKWKQKYEPPESVISNTGLLPTGWEQVSLGQLGDVVTGFTPPTSNPAFFDGNVPFFKPTDLDAGYNTRVAREFLSEEGAAVGRKLPEMSVLVTCIGATIGKVGLARVECATNQQINAIVPRIVAAEWLFWCLTSPLGQIQIRSNASATTLPILNKSKFERLLIPLPPLAEQRRIVQEVEDKLSVADAVAAQVERDLERAKRLRQSILSRAFAGQLVPQDPNDEPASKLLESLKAEALTAAPTKTRGKRQPKRAV